MELESIPSFSILESIFGILLIGKTSISLELVWCVINCVCCAICDLDLSLCAMWSKTCLTYSLSININIVSLRLVSSIYNILGISNQNLII